jgi:hypothetical protein
MDNRRENKQDRQLLLPVFFCGGNPCKSSFSEEAGIDKALRPVI